MNDASATKVGACVTAAGLAGATEPELLRGFCERAVAATASPKSTCAWPGGWMRGTNTSRIRCRRSRT